MSIHPRRTFGPRANLNMEQIARFANKRPHPVREQGNFKFFFGGVVNTPVEQRLAQLMNRRGA